jgi:pimeloyl-ACP methyl ester carboxylesterase
MPKATINGVTLYYEVTGSGYPLVFVHEFAGDCRSWDPQAQFFARRYTVVTYNARGYPPSDVPEDPGAYSQQMAVDDLYFLMRHLRLDRAHLCGLSMGGFAVLHFGFQHPEMARSLVVAGCGYGAVKAERERFHRDTEATAQRMEREGMAAMAPVYGAGPTRVQFEAKDPLGYRRFVEQLAGHSGVGSARTLMGVQRLRPSLYDLQDRMEALDVPTLIVTGDEDDPCLEPALLMKRKIPRAGLLVLPKTGHTINLEEPEGFNRALLDFFTAVEADRWPRRDPRSLSPSAIFAGQPK